MLRYRDHQYKLAPLTQTQLDSIGTLAAQIRSARAPSEKLDHTLDLLAATITPAEPGGPAITEVVPDASRLTRGEIHELLEFGGTVARTLQQRYQPRSG